MEDINTKIQDTKFSTEVTHFIYDNGLSQYAIAKAINVSRGQLNKMLNGKTPWTKRCVYLVSKYMQEHKK